MGNDFAKLSVGERITTYHSMIELYTKLLEKRPNDWWVRSQLSRYTNNLEKEKKKRE